jgi:hypothetical protein
VAFRGGSGALWALIGAGVLFGAGCGGGREAAGALETAAPYLARFERFDGWARRALDAGPAIRSRAMLEETVFAPLVLETGIVDAWVTRTRIEPRRWSLRGLARPEEGFVRVRHPAAGPLEVLEVELRDARGERRPSLLLGRSKRSPSGAEIEVVVAFVRDGIAR